MTYEEPRKLKIAISPQDAARWFLRDMAQASGYYIDAEPNHDATLAGYSVYRPLLTAPDPWYFAGVIALEGCKVIDFYPKMFADEVMRHIFGFADRTVGRDGAEVADLAALIMGRLGIGAVLMRGKAPDSVLGKVMMILIGSEKAVENKMPAPEAHKQLRAALKLGKPVWWRAFRKRYRLSFNPAAEPDSVLRHIVPLLEEPEELELSDMEEGAFLLEAQAEAEEIRTEGVFADAIAGLVADLPDLVPAEPL